MSRLCSSSSSLTLIGTMARGGSRPNSGTPPGHQFDNRRLKTTAVNCLPDAPQSPDSPVLPPVNADTGWLHTAAALRARGVTYNEIARQTGKSAEHLSDVLRARPELIAHYVHEITDPLHYFDPMIPDAVNAYELALRQRDDPRLAFNAGTEVFNRKFGGTVQRSEQSQGIQVTLNMVSFQASAEEPPRIIDQPDSDP